MRAEPESIDLQPPERAAWSPRNIVVGISSFLGRWNYWYAEREVLIETVPAEAAVGLYYIRSNFQKRYEQARTPVLITLPPRVDTTTKDNVKIHVMADGYLSKNVGFNSRKIPSAIVIQLEPLPNNLVFFGHTDLAGRTTLTLRTTEEPDVRVSKSRGFAGFTLALAETADKLEDGGAVSGGHVTSVEVAQVAEDVLVRVKTLNADVEVRSKNGFDPIRKEHILTLDLMEKGTRTPSGAQIRSALQVPGFSLGDPCLRIGADVLRRDIDPQLLARAFRPTGSLADLFRREALKRLGRLNKGTIRTDSGDMLRTGSPIELELGLQTASRVIDYFELLIAFARTRPDPQTSLRSLVAPEMGSAAFAPLWSEIEASRDGCGR
ncbi:MAG: hypothetical protein GY725_07440 [bacterium]|nr:hypothetical protein [bacterium]